MTADYDVRVVQSVIEATPFGAGALNGILAEVVAEREAAESARDDAEDAADEAQAAAGIITAGKVFKTYALASAAALSNGDVVEVVQDETRQYRRVRYMKTAGGLDFLSTMPQALGGRTVSFDAVRGTRYVDTGGGKRAVCPQLYVDHSRTTSGNGLTAAAAFRNFPDMLASAAFTANGSSIAGLTIGVRNGNGVARDALRRENDNSVSVVGYGAGDPTYIDGTDAALSTDFTQHPSKSGAYRIVWTHQLGIDENPASSFSQYSKFRIWQNSIPLKRVENEADLVAGTFWFPPARTAMVGGTTTLSVFPRDGVDPRTAGTFEITRRHDMLRLGDDAFVQGIWMRRSGARNGPLFLGSNHLTIGLIAEEGHDHNWVMGEGVAIEVWAVNCAGDDEFKGEGWGGTTLGNTFANVFSGLGFRMIGGGFVCDTAVYGGMVSTGGKTAGVHNAHPGTGDIPIGVQHFTGIVVEGTGYGFDADAVDAVWDDSLLGGANASIGNNDTIRSATRPVTVRNSVFNGGKRFVNAPNWTITGCLAITNTGDVGQVGLFWGGLTSYTDPASVEFRSNIVISTTPSHVAQIAVGTGNGGFLIASHNILVGALSPIWVNSDTATPSPAAQIDSDRNLFVLHPDTPSGDANPVYVAKYRGLFRTLAAWIGFGYDAHSSQTPFAGAGFASGMLPTMTSIDIRLTAGGLADAAGMSVITQTDVDRIMSMPRGLEDIKDHLRSFGGYLEVAAL